MSAVLTNNSALPFLIESRSHNLPLADCVAKERDRFQKHLQESGAVLLRGFQSNSVSEFEEFARRMSTRLLEYEERSSPRSQITGMVYTATDYPARETIFLHNEQSYNLTFPQVLMFYCVQPAKNGGETLLADCRKILNSLDPALVQSFRERRYLLVRNFRSNLGLSWQEAFQTKEKSGVEQYCRGNDIDLEWLDNDSLRTRQIRDAVARHARADDLTWFNHITFFHVSTLDSTIRQFLLEEFGENGLPNNTYYGDGSPIESEVLDALRRAYDENTVRVEWQKGDVLLIDNLLAAHGRAPFVGTRDVVVVLADPLDWGEVSA